MRKKLVTIEDSSSVQSSGRLKLNVAPFPSVLFSAHILPPWASTILLEIYNPRPVPEKDFEANFENSFGIISAWIPEPVSLTLTTTTSLASSLSLFLDFH